MPKYGYPVDIANLGTNLHTTEAKNIDLSRDMQIVIMKYAPDSQVVAGSKLWIGRYVKQVPNRELVRYHYLHWRHGYFGKVLDVKLGQPPKLTYPICEERQAYSLTFVVRKFSFIAEEKPEKPRIKRLEHTYTSKKFFLV